MAGLLFTVVGAYVVERALYQMREQRETIQQAAQISAQALQSHIGYALSSTALLATILQQYGAIRDFDTLAAEILATHGGISALQLAPDGVISRSYPLAGYENDIGLNLLTDPAYREDARAMISSRKSMFVPRQRRRNEMAIVGSRPIFVTDRNGQDHFWGFVIAVYRQSDIVASAHLDQLSRGELAFALTYQRQGGADSTPILTANTMVPGDPVSRVVRLPNDGIVTLSVAPRQGWTPPLPLYREALLLVLATLLLFALTYQIIRRREVLQSKVQKATQELAATNQQLEQEIVERNIAAKKIAHLNRTYAVLSGINEAIVRTRDRQALLDSACRLLIEAGQFQLALVYLTKDNSDDFDVVARYGEGGHFIERLGGVVKERPDASGHDNARDSGLGSVLGRTTTSECGTGWCRAAIDCGYQSCAAFPLRVGGREIGGIALFSMDRELFAADAIALLRQLADDLSFALDAFDQDERRKRAEDQMNFLAYHDVLTGLPNRALFNMRLEQALVQARRNDARAAAMFLDLDRFNLVNETFGHSTGDELLKEVSQRLLGCVRHSDSVARLGGDEFAVILSNLSDTHAAGRVAQKIVDTLSVPMRIGGREVFTSPSIGIGIFPEDGTDAETLIKNADSAMYRVMERGGNNYQFYTQDMNARSSERMSLEVRLRHALERNEFRPYYQPLIDAASGKIIGAEVLLRWDNNGEGLLHPGAFISLLEETGLIVPVGEWVLRTACMQHKLWQEAGHPGLIVAVNFSAQQFRQPNLVEVVERCLAQTGCEPRFLEIELTERALMPNAEDTIDTLTQLKTLGVRLSIDDFGTGYSSLSYLKRFPLDSLKIDKSFIRDVPHAADALAIVKAIIAMGHGLRLEVVGEGVETWAQMEFLKANRCDRLQGFYLSHPLPNSEFVELLNRQAGASAPQTQSKIRHQ